MKVRIGRKRPPQIVARLRPLSEPMMNHAGMKEQACVLGPQLQRLRHGGERLFRLVILIERPGQEVVCVDVSPDLQLFPGELERFRQLPVVVGIKVGSLSIIQDFIYGVQVADVLHKVVLFLRLVSLSLLRVHIAEG